MALAEDNVVLLEIVNPVGQVVYREELAATDQKIRHRLALNIANGNYLLKLGSQTGTKTTVISVNR